MTTAINVSTHLLQRAPTQRVYLRQRWGDAWVEYPGLFCTSLRGAVAPAIPQAEFHWLYGPVQYAGETAPSYRPPLDVLGWFVKTELDVTAADGAVSTIKNYGVIWEEDRERRGRQMFGGQLTASGQQHLVAFGLEFLYRRQRVDKSIIEKLDGSEATIHRGLTFNGPNLVDRDRGNRSASINGSLHYRFTENLAAAAAWSTNNIVNYLHRVFKPLAAGEFDTMDWQLDSASLSILSSDDRPVLDAHLRTLGELLDALVNRRRGLGWMVFVNTVGALEYPFIRFLSLASTSVIMPDGWTLPAAERQYTLDTDDAVQALSPIIKRSLSAQYDQVRVVGERIRAVFTVSAADDTLAADWTAAQRNLYNAGASTQGDYPSETFEREAANDRVRRRQDLARVFACFKLPTTFAYVGDGVGGAAVPWLPDVMGGAPEPLFRPEFRLLPFLPIEEHAIAGEATQYLRPLVLLRVKDAADDVYMPIDQLGQLARVEEYGDGNGARWSGHVRMSEHDAGFWVHTSGAPQHVLAGDAASDFVSLGDGSDDREPPQYDWREDLLATVAAEAQRHVEAVWPADGTITQVDMVRRLWIDIGEQGRLDYLAEGTVIGLEEDGKLVHQGAGAFLRDDRTRMQTLARQAYVWYQRIRQAVSLPFAGIYTGLAVGDYLVEVGTATDAEPIEAIVSSVEHDLLNGRTTIQTDYAELDFRRI